MNILIDSRSVNLHSGTGIGTYTNNLVLNLINSYNDDKFNLIWTGPINNNFKKRNTRISCISGKYLGFYDDYYIPNLMLTENIDLYHIPQNGIGFPFKPSSNVVITIHDLIPYVMPETVGSGYLNRFLKDMPYIISSSKGIITVSEYSKSDILRFFPNYPKENIYVTPLAASTNFKPLPKEKCRAFIKSKYKINEPFILYVGGFSTRKNVRNLILSFHKIAKDLKKTYKLLLVGSIKDCGKELIDLVYSIGAHNSILFTGFLEENLLPIFYNAAEAFVYPTLYEGFGLPPLEAMSCKTPVITSNITSIPEVAKDGAILIDPHNIDDLSASLLKLLNNEDLKEELMEYGYKKSLQFSWRRTAASTFEAYKKIIESI